MNSVTIDPNQLNSLLEKVQLLAIDLDGTLLNGNEQLTSETQQALRNSLDSGISITIATGRNQQDTVRLFPELLEKLYLVLFNGALIVHNQSILTCHPIESSKVTELIEFFRYHGATPIVYDIHGIKSIEPVNGADPDFASIYYRYPERFHVVEHLESALAEPILRVGMWNTQENAFRLYEKAQNHYGDMFTMYCFKFKSWIMEILHKKSNKGTALEFIAAYTGISLGSVAAIGNDMNDLPMLQRAGLGIAVKNASQEVKEGAKLVIPSNDENGVAQFLQMVHLTR